MVNQIRFLGSSIRSVGCNLGFNNQSSSLSISLVDDLRFGDSFNPPSVGTPLFFSIGSLSFGGLLQNYSIKRDRSGNPLYEVQLVDPREILAGTQLIIGNYEGTSQNVPNLLNCYGYLENQGFGSSATIEGVGMPWPKILEAINALMQLNSGDYGSRLSFKGYRYKVDLSEVPNPGSLYRFGNNSIGLLELLDQLSTDNGADYYITLQNTEPLTIKYNRVDRANQPPPGVISAFINSQSGNVVSSSTGFELRNEPTSVFLAGGPVHELVLCSQIIPFYGFDKDGAILYGTYSDQPGLLDLIDQTQELIDSLPDGPEKDAAEEVLEDLLDELDDFPDTVKLNAAPIADIIGGFYYTTDILELRAALTSRSMWDNYIVKHRASLAQTIGLKNGPHDLSQMLAANFPNHFKNGKPGEDIKKQLESGQPNEANRVFSFVQSQAQTYYGRQFVVRVPTIAKATEPETQRIIYSHEVADGAFVNENVDLGLTELEEDMFKLQDGRFGAFGKFTRDMNNLALDNIDTNKSVLQTDQSNNPTALYTSVTVDPNIYTLGSMQVVIVEFDRPILQKSNTVIGDLRSLIFTAKGPPRAANVALQAAIGAINDDEVNALKSVFTKAMGEGGFAGLALYYEPIVPSQIAIPFKSNINNYGPWTGIGVPGKTIFKQDDSLVPWNYNGFQKMNQAAQIEIQGTVTNLQAIETGSLTLVGEPIVSLGEPLTSNAPNITNMDISYDVRNGYTTTYHFKTYTPQFGNVSKQVHDRIRRSSLTNLEQGKKIRNLLRANIANRELQARADKKFLENMQKIWQDKSPHSIIVGTIQTDIGNSNKKVVGISSSTFEEGVQVLSLEDTENYKKQAFMPLSALLRPFTNDSSNSNMPSVITAPTGIVNYSSLNPFGSGSDLDYFAWGDDLKETPSGVHRLGANFNKMRIFGLRGPLMVVGWGYDMDGNLTPSDTDRQNKSHLWKAGPVDLLWDQHRGVWSVNNRVVGYLMQSVSTSSGAMQIWDGSGNTTKTLAVWNFFSASTVPSGKVMAEYFPYANKWYITAAECVSG